MKYFWDGAPAWHGVPGSLRRGIRLREVGNYRRALTWPGPRIRRPTGCLVYQARSYRIL